MHSSAETEVTLGEALLQCSMQNARLVAIQTCTQIELLMKEITDTFGKTDQNYFIGTFGFSYKSSLSV